MLLHLGLSRRVRKPPEEEETSMSYSFSGPMYYLRKSYEEVLGDYTMLHEKQAAPDLYA